MLDNLFVPVILFDFLIILFLDMSALMYSIAAAKLMK
jgi:hypothetical protein